MEHKEISEEIYQRICLQSRGVAKDPVLPKHIKNF